MQAAAYIRVSTEEQMEFSPESQLKAIMEYAKAHQCQIADEHIYVDIGISGRKVKNRPAFNRMLVDAKNRPLPFEAILVWKFSRFSRSRNDSILYKNALKHMGIQVISITEPLQDDPTSVLMEALLEAMDEYYSLNLGMEVRRGMEEKFSRGGVVSIPPIGYEMGEEHYIIKEDEACIVREIYTRYLEGQSLEKIATSLNEEEKRTKRGKLFRAREIGYILSNPVYIGMQRRGGKCVYGQQQAIISKDMYEKVKCLCNIRLRNIRNI